MRNSKSRVLTTAEVSLGGRQGPALDESAPLFQPLPLLLRSGGDERLDIVPNTGLNTYGCAPRPRDRAIALSSSTASTVSQRAYARARGARERLIDRAACHAFLEAFDEHIEDMRHSLKMFLGLESSGAEVVFSPSGTDSQLHALFLAQALLGGPLTTIVAGSDQTGSGTAFTAQGRHFGRQTAAGRRVIKGAPLGGDPAEFASIDISFAQPSGRWRTLADIDDCVMAAVEAEIRKGRKVLLQAMHASKFGLRAPSDACLAALTACWPDDILVVVDACQTRIGRAKMAQYLARGYALLVTGSKFFTGPPFSGALLIPKQVSEAAAARLACLAPLRAYIDRSCLPVAWTAVRAQFAVKPNLGQWLRWEAALEEMRHYRMLPAQFRTEVLASLATVIPDLISDSKSLVPLPLPEDLAARDAADEEFVHPTIFPFLIRTGDVDASPGWAKSLCTALNGGEAGAPGADALPPCHIGQPVALGTPDGIGTAAPRICIGSRTLFDAWSPGADPVKRAVETIANDVATAVRALDRLAQDRS